MSGICHFYDIANEISSGFDVHFSTERKLFFFHEIFSYGALCENFCQPAAGKIVFLCFNWKKVINHDRWLKKPELSKSRLIITWAFSTIKSLAFRLTSGGKFAEVKSHWAKNLIRPQTARPETASVTNSQKYILVQQLFSSSLSRPSWKVVFSMKTAYVTRLFPRNF